MTERATPTGIEGATPPMTERATPPVAESATSTACPFCGSEDVELVSLWGGQLITSQFRCRECNTYFEAIRDRSADADG